MLVFSLRCARFPIPNDCQSIRDCGWALVPSSSQQRQGCRYKIAHLGLLPALFAEKEQLNKERASAFDKIRHDHSSGPRSALPALASRVQQWSEIRCAEWLRHEVSLPEHVPVFLGSIDGSKLMCLDESTLLALGIDAIDSEIILAHLQLLDRQCRLLGLEHANSISQGGT